MKIFIYVFALIIATAMCQTPREAVTILLSQLTQQVNNNLITIEKHANKIITRIEDSIKDSRKSANSILEDTIKEIDDILNSSGYPLSYCKTEILKKIDEKSKTFFTDGTKCAQKSMNRIHQELLENIQTVRSSIKDFEKLAKKIYDCSGLHCEKYLQEFSPTYSKAIVLVQKSVFDVEFKQLPKLSEAIICEANLSSKYIADTTSLTKEVATCVSDFMSSMTS